MKNVIKTMIMMFFAGTIITACDKKTEYPEPNTTPVALPIAQTARIKYVHASPDSPEMKFFINNAPVTAGLTNTLTFGQDSPYTTFDVVNATSLNTSVADMTKILFSYTANGAVIDVKKVAYRTSTGTGATAIMGTGNFNAVAGVSYSVFYTDVTSRPNNIQGGKSTDIGGPLLDFIVNDNTFLDFTAPSAARQIKLRLVHLAVGAPAVRVVIGSVEQTDNTVLLTNVAAFTNIAYKVTSTAPPLNVPTTAPADNKLVLKNIQVFANTGTTALLTIPSVTFDMRKAYTLVAVGISGTPSFGVKVITNN
jgi:hypothetical protein